MFTVMDPRTGIHRITFELDFSGGNPKNLRLQLQDVEVKVMDRMLALFDGNVSRAARAMGIGRTALVMRMLRFNMQRADYLPKHSD